MKAIALLSLALLGALQEGCRATPVHPMSSLIVRPGPFQGFSAPVHCSFDPIQTWAEVAPSPSCSERVEALGAMARAWDEPVSMDDWRARVLDLSAMPESSTDPLCGAAAVEIARWRELLALDPPASPELWSARVAATPFPAPYHDALAWWIAARVDDPGAAEAAVAVSDQMSGPMRENALQCAVDALNSGPADPEVLAQLAARHGTLGDTARFPVSALLLQESVRDSSPEAVFWLGLVEADLEAWCTVGDSGWCDVLRDELLLLRARIILSGAVPARNDEERLVAAVLRCYPDGVGAPVVLVAQRGRWTSASADASCLTRSDPPREASLELRVAPR